MRSERVDESDADGLARRWRLDDRTAAAVVALEQEARCALAPCGLRWPGVYVISGYRSSPVEAELSRNSPAATRSLHMATSSGKPASLAVDLRVGGQPASTTPLELWTWLGQIWKRVTPGGRWGGDFTSPDLNHFDLGIREDLHV